MKKSVRKTVFLLLAVIMASSFVLSACKVETSAVDLSAPTNLAVSADKLLTWNNVEGASSYKVKINDDENVASTNSYSLASLANASAFQIYVKAIGGEGYNDSGWSTVYNYYTSVKLNAPNATISGSNLLWGKINNATGYIVSAGGIEHTLDANTTTFSLASALDEAGTHEVKIRSKGNGTIYSDSDWSAPKNFTLVSVTFNFNDGSTEPQTVISYVGDDLEMPVPASDNLVFGGWFEDNNTFYTPFEQNSIPETNIMVYARWLTETDATFDYMVISGAVRITGLKAYGAQFDELAIPSEINGNPVTMIESSAFQRATFSKIIIPATVVSIGNAAFYMCENLDTVEFAPSSALNSIGDGVFESCSSLNSFVIPSTVTKIGSGAFVGTGIYTNSVSNIVTIGDWAVGVKQGTDGNLTVDGVAHVANRAFYGAEITSLTIGNGVLTIGASAFAECPELTNVVIGNGLTVIPERAFYRSLKLKYITFGNSVLEIGKEAFAYCASLIGSDASGLVIPNSVEIIGDSAFNYCYKEVYVDGNLTYEGLTKVVFGTNLKSIGTFAFNYALVLEEISFAGTALTEIKESAFYLTSELSDVVLPVGLEVLGRNVFSMSGIKSVSIPGTVRTMEFGTFSYCDELASLTIADGLTEIGYSAFTSCNSLTSVVIPESVTNILASAFSMCQSLVLEFSSLTPPTVEETTFGLISAGTALRAILIESGAYSNYVNQTEWKSYESIMFSKDLVRDDYLVAVVRDNDGTEIGKRLGVYIGNASVVNLSATDFTEIGVRAFVNNKHITQLILGNNITKIGGSALSGCTNLESIEFGSSLISIGVSAFSGCTSLINVDFGNSLQSIGGNAFDGCTKLAFVSLPASLKNIDAYAFRGCTKLTTLDFQSSGNNGIQTIGDYAFSGCSGLVFVTLPSTVTSLGATMFSGTQVVVRMLSVLPPTQNGSFGSSYDVGCKAIIVPNYTIMDGQVVIDTSLERYKSVWSAYSAKIYCETDIYDNDFLIDHGKNPDGSKGNEGKLIAYIGSTTTLTIPSYVKHIVRNAFSGCKFITDLTIPASVVTVDVFAFGGWTSEQTIRVPFAEGQKPAGWHSLWYLPNESTNPSLVVIVYANP